jgi:hypothetical protein
MTAIEQVLDDIHAIAADDHDKGDRFERLMLQTFQSNRTFRQQFSEMWRWMGRPGRSGVDIGVYLVARDADVAIRQVLRADGDADAIGDRLIRRVLSGQKRWSRRTSWRRLTCGRPTR